MNVDMNTMNTLNSITSNVLKVTTAACMITGTGVLVIGGGVGGYRLFKLSKTAEGTLKEGAVTLREIGEASKEAKATLEDTRVVIKNVGNIATTVDTNLENLGKTLNEIGTSAKESIDVFNDTFKNVTSQIDMTKYEPQIKNILDSVSNAINAASKIADQIDVKLVNDAVKSGSKLLNELKKTVEKVKNGEMATDESGEPTTIAKIANMILQLFSALMNAAKK